MTADGGMAWQALARERARLEGFDLRRAFAEDPGRAVRYRVQAAGLTLDYSRNLVDDGVLDALAGLAAGRGLRAELDAQLGGTVCNGTEGRAVLHTLLRGSDAGAPLPQAAEVRETLARMAGIVQAVRSGAWRGFGGAPIRAVVNIGIGGSHLGPFLVSEALAHLAGDGPRQHYVSNVDPRDIEDTLAALDPATTLFVIASKTFTTLETLANAGCARAWLLAAGCAEADLGKHFLAVSASVPRAVAFGIAPANVLPMWDWVGGRYSLWSAIGLPVAIGFGMDAFEGLLAGAHRMDRHAREAEPAANMPLLMALLGVWYRNCWGTASHAVLPYDQRLGRLPEFLQQLVMESNGKSVDRAGRPLARASSGVLWGAAGTNGQHSFHQMLHQGTERVPVDFIVPLRTHARNHAQHAQLVANAIAQAQALMLGRTLEESREDLRRRGQPEAEVERLAPHLVMPGNRPSNLVLLRSVTPGTLGALLALYEHRTAFEGWIWDLNSFDQYGVELGKQLGERVHAAMVNGVGSGNFDAATAAAIEAWRAANP
jgi:glucose-6-phosphate isomerase